MTDTSSTSDCLAQCGVVPVVTIEHVAHAVPLANALLAGGINSIEVTLRTPKAMECIAEIVAANTGISVGVGTVTNTKQIDEIAKIAADFIVTPATPAALVPALKDFNGLVLPGTATPTEALTLYSQGFEIVKFFPAEAAGGAPMLKALSGPLPQIKFMPTGGISPQNVKTYLDLPNVVAAGGSWITPKAHLDAENWDAITALAKDARPA